VTQVPFAAPGRWSPGGATTVVVATVGLALNLRAWILLSPVLAARPDLSVPGYGALMALPLLVAAVLRLPVGVLTDRYGARVMFPAVSLASGASVTALALATSLPVVAVAGATAGVAGTAFVVGAGLVSRAVGYGRRGLALGVLSLGTALGVGISAVSRFADPGGRRAALLLAAGLVGFAVVALVLVRDRDGRHYGSPLRRGLEMVRLAAGTSLSLLYTLALGGVLAVTVYLPAYLSAGFGLPWFDALTITAPVVVVATGARLVGGWWTDRRPTTHLLVFCYATAAGLCLLLAVAPRVWWWTGPLIALVAVCDGLASGILLALIGKAAPSEGVGAVMGATGAFAACGAVGLSSLLAVVDRLSGSLALAWLLLAVVLCAVAWYVRAHGLRVGMGLAVRSPAPHSPTAMTVAVVGESDTRYGAAAVVARLADLATRDELVVVYGSDRPTPSGGRDTPLLAGLRERLPRHHVVAVRAGSDGIAVHASAVLVGDAVESGAVALAVTPTTRVGDVTAHLSALLHADRVLRVSYTLAAGARVHPVWERRDTTTGLGPA
jgi:MFS transporter, NNP family, nitrate/nitrite transporter